MFINDTRRDQSEREKAISDEAAAVYTLGGALLFPKVRRNMPCKSGIQQGTKARIILYTSTMSSVFKGPTGVHIFDAILFLFAGLARRVPSVYDVALFIY